MAEQPWFYADVEYDHDTAHDAMHELAYAAESLGEALALVESDMPHVVEDWEGEARLAFDEGMRDLVESGHALVALLLNAAVGVELAEDAAFEESRLRRGLVEEHEAQLAAGATAGG